MYETLFPNFSSINLYLLCSNYLRNKINIFSISKIIYIYIYIYIYIFVDKDLAFAKDCIVVQI